MTDLNQKKNELKPIYTWPHPKIPFRHYFNSQELKIFIIENIPHNYYWLKKYRERIKKNHFFFVYCGWYHSPVFAKNSDDIFRELCLDKSNFFFLFNSELEKKNLIEKGFHGDLINQNCWLDEQIIRPSPEAQKKFNGIMVARKAAFKRHYLAAKLRDLALISSGPSHQTSNLPYELPNAVFQSEAPLSTEAVCEKISESKCGLILSAEEGACFSSSEYLLCGVPVVSTPSVGGRDVWYDGYNSIVCEPNEDAVLGAVQTLIKNPRDPVRIRNTHIEKSKVYRERFVRALAEVFARFSVKLDAREYFKDNFFHKMRGAVDPNFEEMF